MHCLIGMRKYFFGNSHVRRVTNYFNSRLYHKSSPSGGISLGIHKSVNELYHKNEVVIEL